MDLRDGHVQRGGFTGVLACRLSGRIAAFAPVSGAAMTAVAAKPDRTGGTGRSGR
ncbi:hypothetical protein [Amycolatopsis thermophila]|uniref:Uncharacterized protein n=1 Tax=Amycolatopsis thermophila TaxID=206084 RepID=A0ABU0F3U1_9PSEU|nr:hypothetical protein [Amycolatopsis thermophila]MDQ0382196.1 hypothetical protein [Amycolatopsis thermophila]